MLWLKRDLTKGQFLNKFILCDNMFVLNPNARILRQIVLLYLNLILDKKKLN